VVIQTGHNITINSVTDNGPCAQSPDGLGRSNVGPFTASNIVMFYQTGDILIKGTLTVSGIEMMTEGYTKIVSGGVFNLTSSYVNLGFLEADAGSTLSAADDLILAGNSSTVINTTSISNDDLIISFTNATLCGTGTTTLQNGSGSVITFANGATVAQICNTFTVACTGVGCSGFPVVGTANLVSGNVGPGGVGNASENVLWLMGTAGTSTTTTGAGVSTWSDQSGNANHATQSVAAQRPTYQPTVINNQPALLFDNAAGPNNDELVIADNNNLDNTSGLTILTVSRPLNLDGNARTIVSKRTAANTEHSYGFLYFTSNNLYTDINTTNDRFATPATFTNSTNYINNLFYNGTLAAASRARVYVNGALNVTATETSATIPNYASSVTIGSINVGDGRPFGGSIAELAIYREVLNEAQRTIADNYLSAKYAITISNDVYTMDNAGNGNYDFEMVGIGQAADGSNHRDAIGKGLVRIWNPSSLSNNEYLMFGHDNGPLNGSTSGVGAPIQERLTRIWRVSEQGDVGTVSISFDIASLADPLGSNLRLLIDRDGDGFADNDVPPVTGSFVDNTIVFSGVNFSSGDRFTLGNTNSSVPLPIELISFTAEVVNNEVILKWATASEVNNHFFTIQRSKSAEKWEDIETIEGAGNSQVRINYETSDGMPYQGVSYYRLKQTDFDGTSTYSFFKRVQIDGGYQLKAFPNPTTGKLSVVTGFSLELNDIRLMNSIGQQMPIVVTKLGAEAEIEGQNLPAGIYILQVRKGFWQQSLRIVITDN
jgi:hypothetical protein